MPVDKNMPVMIVDDYSTMRRIIRGMLNQLGFKNCDEAADGASALAKLEERPCALVISDWNMQPMTGLELLQHIRANAKFGQVPFIMVTAESKPENVITARNAGVSNYIVKPFNVETFKTKLTSVIGEF